MHTICRYRGTGTTQLVTTYVAEWSRSKTDQDESPRVLRFLRCVLESRIQIHPTFGRQNWTRYGTNTDLTNSWIWQPEKCNSFGTHYQVLPSRSIFGFIWGPFSHSRPCSKTLIGNRNAYAEICMHNAKEVAAENAWWNGNSNNPQGNWIVHHRKWLTYSNATLPTQYYQRQHHCRLDNEERRKKLPLPRHSWEQENSRKYILGTQPTVYVQLHLPKVCYRKFSSRTKLIGRRRGDRPRTRAIDNNYAKRAEHVTRSRRLDAISHCGSRNAVSLSLRTGRICQNSGKLTVLCHRWICHGWKQFHSDNTQGQGILVIQAYKQPLLNDHVKVGSVTGSEVFESAGTLVTEEQVPSRQPGNLKSWVRMSRGNEQYGRNFNPEETDQQNSGGVLSPQPPSCGRRGHRRKVNAQQ